MADAEITRIKVDNEQVKPLLNISATSKLCLKVIFQVLNFSLMIFCNRLSHGVKVNQLFYPVNLSFPERIQ